MLISRATRLQANHRFESDTIACLTQARLGTLEDLRLPYPAELVATLLQEHTAVQSELQRLFLEAVQAGQSLTDGRAKEHMLQGAGRRLKVLRRCLANVFRLFPPSKATPLDSEDLDEVQISLHAFVINLYGLFENLAWCFVLRHGLETEVGDRRRIGMFLKSTQQYLPSPLRSYLTSDTLLIWQNEYLKNYRDSLAHRIPLYIPPATYTPEQEQRYHTLDTSEWESIRLQQWDRLEEIRREKATLGSACPMFLHSYTDDGRARPVYLHPQMLCDAKTVLEFCGLYFAHWHERA